jgi:long-chain acyl-CoA synthetase
MWKPNTPIKVDRFGHVSVGKPFPAVEVSIMDGDEQLSPNRVGEIVVKSAATPRGYLNNPSANEALFVEPDTIRSGDLGYIADGELYITGRAKDTIVLTNGENIEPQPVENACARSKYVDQIMLVGQDQKVLGALIVPNLEALSQWATGQGITINETNPAESLDNPKVHTLFKQELTREVKARPGYRPDERIGPFTLLSMPFSIENGMLTQTMKIKRPVVTRNYQDVIDGLFEQ